MLIKYKIISALVPTVGAGVGVAFYLTRNKTVETPSTVSDIFNDDNNPTGTITKNLGDGKVFKGTKSIYGGMGSFEIGTKENLQ